MKKIIVKTDFCDENWAASAELECGVVIVTSRSFDEMKVAVDEAIRIHVAGCVDDGDVVAEWLRHGDYELVFEYCRPNE